MTLLRRLLALPLPAKARLLYRLALDRRTGLRFKLALLGVAAYLASPIDLIPDFIPLIGHLDDVLLAILALAILGLLVPRPVLEEHLQGLEGEGCRAGP